MSPHVLSPCGPLCPGIILGDGRARPLRHHHLHHQKESGPSKIKVSTKIPNLKLRSHHLPTPVPSACSCLNSACPHHHLTAHPMCSKASAHTLGSPVQGHSLPACTLHYCFPSSHAGRWRCPLRDLLVRLWDLS